MIDDDRWTYLGTVKIAKYSFKLQLFSIFVVGIPLTYHSHNRCFNWCLLNWFPGSNSTWGFEFRPWPFFWKHCWFVKKTTWQSQTHLDGKALSISTSYLSLIFIVHNALHVEWPVRLRKFPKHKRNVPWQHLFPVRTDEFFDVDALCKTHLVNKSNLIIWLLMITHYWFPFQVAMWGKTLNSPWFTSFNAMGVIFCGSGRLTLRLRWTAYAPSSKRAIEKNLVV